jgi:hypothetical protein
MKFITYHVIPTEDLDKKDNIGGAYVNCFIESESSSHSQEIAKKQLSQLHWEIIELEELTIIDQNTVSEENKEYYEQALIDKEVFVFYTYPTEEPKT